MSEFCFHLSAILTVKCCLAILKFSVTYPDMLFLYALNILFTYILSHLHWLLMWINFRRNYYACPDDETFRFLASVYSRSHHNMSLSNEFQGGITNGAYWYCNLLKACVLISGFHFSYQLTWNSSFSLAVVSRLTCCRYPIYGGMQDWNYIYGGCFELTLEISDNKWPPGNEVRLKLVYSNDYS